jgi:hypothetical protein
LANEAKNLGNLHADDAQALLDWADEYGLNSHDVMTHSGRSGFGGTVPHITIGPVSHIPVLVP